MTIRPARFDAAGYRLTTAEILYHLPDHPDILQTFVWQQVDLPPRLPRLAAFLEFWRRNIDGALHSVRVAGASEDTPRVAFADHLLRLQ